MVSSLNLLVTVVSLASVATANNLDTFSFVKSKKASEYNGTPLEVHYRTTPSALRDYEASVAFKPIVNRLYGDAIVFTPFHRVVPGEMEPFGCRKEGNLVIRPLPDHCEDRCQNHGRYCAFRDELPTSRQNPAMENILGRDLVAESARRQCVFQLYGAKEYFRYMDAMHAFGCHDTLQSACLDEVFVSLDVLRGEVEMCMGVMKWDRVKHNQLLEGMMEEGHGIGANVPDFSVDGEAPTTVGFPHDGFDTAVAFQAICDAFPDQDKKPKVCDFCLNYCQKTPGIHADVGKCLWNLQCGDKDHNNFDDYLMSLGENPEVFVEESPTFTAVKKHSVDTITITGTLVAIALVITVVGLAFMVTARSYKNKSIVDQYLKEQTERQRGSGGGAGGVHQHLDPSFFPEDNELDLDLEPAMQYRDHINPTSPQQPPSRHTFLPQIS